MRGSSLKSFLLAAAVSLFVTSVKAAISFGATGTGVLTFDSAPAATEWSTTFLPTDAATFADEAGIDGAVAALTAAGIATVLPTSGTVPPSTSGAGARYNTAGFYLQTRPTGVGCVVLLATLSNDSGSDQAAVDITYNLDRFSLAATPGELVGHDVYYSLTGAAGEWVKIPGLTRMETPGALTTTISPAGGWLAGGTLYLLWVDDNANGITDPSYTIDNFSVALSGAPPSVDVQPPPTVTLAERGTLTLSIVGSGSAITYQWFQGATALANGTTCGDGHGKTISGATGSTLTIAGVQASDDALYHCEVSGPGGPTAVSMNADVTVTPDTVAPKILYATCGATPNEIIVVFSEPMFDSCGPIGTGPVTDIGNWIIEHPDSTPPTPLGASGITNMGTFADQTVLGFTTSNPRDPARPVRIEWIIGLPDASKNLNEMPPGSTLALCNTNELLSLNANWQYNDEDVDPGATWKDVGFTDTGAPWETGAGPFDAKRDGGIVHANGLDDCRAMTFYGLGAVGTCLNLQSPVTMTNLITAYFRTHFNFSGTPSASTLLVLEGKFDDGGAVYLNGTEIWRTGLAAGATHTTLGGRTGTGAGAVGDGDPQDALILGGPSSLVAGDNVLAVELHQQALTSSDLTMGLRVSQLVSEPPLLVRIVNNGDGTVTLTWPGGGTLRSTTSITTARPWPVVTGATSPYTTAPAGTQRFYDISVP